MNKIRCAIYTRKSSEEGLDQNFNSLDAQYEACAAYISSQRHEGWKLVKKRYDDGGISGGTMERPGLLKLLADIDAGLVDRIVVYKIDRLTRSLSDFAKIVDLLDTKDASFVSVTQSFNTATSMGRLTLNMLLSFAQFEREVTAERIRDKIAASKAKGLWMGGTVPLGYDPNPDKNIRGLIVNDPEAETVKTIFVLYLQRGNLSRVREKCEQLGIRSKYRSQYQSRLKGGSIMTNGQIHHILTNPIYIGKIRHKNQIHEGLHEAIIHQDLWDQVQTKLQSASMRRRGQVNDPSQDRAPLRQKLFDETGDHLTPTHTKRKGKIIRYYISNRLIKAKDPSGWRLSATQIEAALVDCLKTTVLNDNCIAFLPHTSPADIITIRKNLAVFLEQCQPKKLLGLIKRVDLRPGEVSIELNLQHLIEAIACKKEVINKEMLTITQPLNIKRRGVEGKVIIGEFTSQPNRKLQEMLARSHHWADQIKQGKPIKEIANEENITSSFIRTRLPIAFLSPKIQSLILNGKQPANWSIKTFPNSAIPSKWCDQEKRFLES